MSQSLPVTPVQVKYENININEKRSYSENLNKNSKKRKIDNQSLIENYFHKTNETQVSQISTLNQLFDESQSERIIFETYIKSSQESPKFFYNLENLNFILELVEKRDSHLFTTLELKILNSFKNLEMNQKILFSRLLYRKGPWFRIENINYKDIDCLQAIKGLIEINFLETPFHPSQVLHLYTTEELKKFTSIKKKLKKENLLSSAHDLVTSNLIIGPQYFQSKSLSKSVRIKETVDDFFNLIHRLFFMTKEQVQNTMYFVRTGELKFPFYLCEKTFDLKNDSRKYLQPFEVFNFNSMIKNGLRTVFPSRKHFDEYDFAMMKVTEISELTLQEIDINNDSTDKTKRMKQTPNIQALKNPELVSKALAIVEEVFSIYEQSSFVTDEFFVSNKILNRYTAKWVFSGIISVGIDLLERKRKYEDACKYLNFLIAQNQVNLSKRGDWWIRLVLDLCHLNKKDEAIKNIKIALSDQNCRQQHIMRLENKLESLLKNKTSKENIKLETTLLKGNFNSIEGSRKILENGKNSFINSSGLPCSVEDFALEYYLSFKEWKFGRHCEGQPLTMIFSLLFWDILFESSIPYAFQSPYQDCPLDFTSEFFYLNRQGSIDKRLNEIIHSDSFTQIKIEECYLKWNGFCCRGVDWSSWKMEELLEISYCLGNEVLQMICDRFVKDYRFTHSGLPDLLLWNPETKKSKLVEVKGPRDTLSEKQKIWIHFLFQKGCDVEVLRVEEKK